MIAYLAASLAGGRQIAANYLELVARAERAGRVLLYPARTGAAAVGFLATTLDHLRGAELAGYVVLEDVPAALTAAAFAQVRRSVA